MLSLLFQLASAAPQPVYHGRAGETSVNIPRLAESIVVDALLNEPAWVGSPGTELEFAL